VWVNYGGEVIYGGGHGCGWWLMIWLVWYERVRLSWWLSWVGG
jgi:hypothetical protein